jgi:hypothetical protein
VTNSGFERHLDLRDRSRDGRARADDDRADRPRAERAGHHHDHPVARSEVPPERPAPEAVSFRGSTCVQVGLDRAPVGDSGSAPEVLPMLLRARSCSWLSPPLGDRITGARVSRRAPR